ncbi:hypothetical protein LWI28_019895 [Acer negundo]|uniref:Uncharacterized protein n=1 Tax=Acer negundo TaxID=4023 RepID=A0AAD5IKE6_ACENE|nr:hypothetical protein LWI28_019895 [Acer negundo]
MKISGGCCLLSDVDVVQGDEVWKMTRCLASLSCILVWFELGFDGFEVLDLKWFGFVWRQRWGFLGSLGGGGDGLSIWVCLLNDVLEMMVEEKNLWFDGGGRGVDDEEWVMVYMR